MRILKVGRIWNFSICFLTALAFFIFSKASAENLELGKKLFDGKCARCHGQDGSGNPKMAKLLKVPVKKIDLHRADVVKMSAYQIEVMVDTGKHRMPKYRGKLTDAQIHDVAWYVKTLTGNESVEENGIAK